jgi:predicted nucleic acid-binding protein
MQYLVDTGVLLRLFDQDDSEHPTILKLLRLLRVRGDALMMCPQNIAEFWNASTRPTTARGGYGRTVESTEHRVRYIERLGTILVESALAYSHWRRLVVDYGLVGVSVHDARLVAMMKVARIEAIITLNAKDFTRYDGIEPRTPDALLNQLT